MKHVALLACSLTACVAVSKHEQGIVPLGEDAGRVDPDAMDARGPDAGKPDAGKPDATTPVSELSDDLCATAVPDLRTSEGTALAREIGRRFVASQSFRRLALERSLINKTNSYATLRLANYALDGRWDALPEFDVITRRLRANADATLSVDTVVPRPTSDGEPTLQDSLELGEWAFFNVAGQDNPELANVVLDTNRGSRVAQSSYGIWQDARGYLGGLVEIEYRDGSTSVSLTCATCHAVPDSDGKLLTGAPSLIQLSDQTGKPWGASLVDVTGDGINNPVTIADLRATRFQRRLHWTGNVQNGLAALAVRVDTLLITARAGVRVPRDIVFGLALYIWQLGERLSGASQPEPSTAEDPTVEHGRELFETQCAACHSGLWGAGDWVPAVNVGTDPAAANSPDRGTGGYRVPALLGFMDRSWTHEARNHEAWLTVDAPVAHPLGTVLTADDYSALRSYVSRLGE